MSEGNKGSRLLGMDALSAGSELEALASSTAPESIRGRRETDRAGGASLQEFFIPVHGLVRLNMDEIEVVNHPAFQHLGYIFQLGQTFLVYRGANHTRYEHALGTRHVAELLIQAVRRNSREGRPPDPNLRDGDWELDDPLTPTEKRFVRLGALLHDIGHLPAGHTLEDELGLFGAHDEAERLLLVWDRPTWRGEDPPQTLRQVVDERFGADATKANVRHAASRIALTATEIVELLISKEPPSVLPSASFRTDVCRDLIGNTICADLLDYLHRDWYHIGKERFFDTRLLEYLEIRARETPDGREAKLVINLRTGHRIRTDAVTAILDLLESRYQLAEIALFHRTKLSAAAMLERAIAEIGEHHPNGAELLERLPERLLDTTDAEMLTEIGSLAIEALGSPKLEASDRAALAGALELTRALRVRRLHKHLTSAFAYELHRATKAVQDRYSGPVAKRSSDRQSNARIGAQNRLRATRLLERDFGMAPATLVMYCPPRNMNTKIAEVQVLIHGDVYRLDSFEGDERSDRGITGGHLQAQKDRFRRLWRVQFAIDRREHQRLADLGLLQLLGRAIDLCVLRREPAIGSIDDAVAALAVEMAAVKGSPIHGREIAVSWAARQRQILAYPGGAISLVDHAQEPAA